MRPSTRPSASITCQRPSALLRGCHKRRHSRKTPLSRTETHVVEQGAPVRRVQATVNPNNTAFLGTVKRETRSRPMEPLAARSPNRSRFAGSRDRMTRVFRNRTVIRHVSERPRRSQVDRLPRKLPDSRAFSWYSRCGLCRRAVRRLHERDSGLTDSNDGLVSAKPKQSSVSTSARAPSRPSS